MLDDLIERILVPHIWSFKLLHPVVCKRVRGGVTVVYRVLSCSHFQTSVSNCGSPHVLQQYLPSRSENQHKVKHTVAVHGAARSWLSTAAVAANPQAPTHKLLALGSEHHDADVEGGPCLGPLLKILRLDCGPQLICGQTSDTRHRWQHMSDS
jgi:hypothetical protein